MVSAQAFENANFYALLFKTRHLKPVATRHQLQGSIGNRALLGLTDRVEGCHLAVEGDLRHPEGGRVDDGSDPHEKFRTRTFSERAGNRGQVDAGSRHGGVVGLLFREGVAAHEAGHGCPR